MDNLSNKVNLLVRKVMDSLVRIVDCPINSITKAELFREPDSDVAKVVCVAACTDMLDQRRLVLSVNERLKLFFKPESLAEVCLLYSHSVRSRGGALPETYLAHLAAGTPAAQARV